MKKLLAIILAGLMVFSAMGVFAEESTTTEDTTTPSTVGVFVNSTGVQYSKFEEDFDVTTVTTYNASKTEQGFSIYTRRNDASGASVGSSKRLVKNSIEVLETSVKGKDAGNKYLKMEDIEGYTQNRVLFILNGSNPGVDEQVEFSFDMKTDDLNYDKTASLVEHQNTAASDRVDLVTLSAGNSGETTIKFMGNDSGVVYSAGEWYHFDIVFNYEKDTIRFSVDGLECATYTSQNLNSLYSADSDYNKWHYFGFVIPNSADDTNLSSLCIDDIIIEISKAPVVEPDPEPDPEPEPEITIPETSGTMNGELIDETTSYTNYFTDDFEEEASVSSTTGTRKGVTIDIRYATGSGGTNRAPFDLVSENSVSESSNNYMVFYQPSTRIDNYGPAYQYRFAFDNLAQSEEIHLAFDMKNMDSVSSKQVFLSRSNQPLQARDSRTRNLVYMGKDGLMHFGNFDTSIDDDYSISYNISQWYHFDIVFDYTSVTVENEVVTAASGEVRYYVDGVLVYTVTNVDFYDIRNNSEGNYFSRFGFGIDNKEEYSELKTINGDSGTQPFAEEMKLGVDNLYVQIISAENEPNVTIATPAYSLTDFAVTDFTIGQAGTITASATLTNTDPTKKVTFAIATYNANNELTGIKIGATYVLSGNISLTSDVAATDTCVKVFVLDDAASITPIQAATVIGTQAS
ncbi:MAG: hypothetical protein E7395_06075 [Ruminococcaceae bacterium]|nr:hypothetical protein [Oscillospiraceae bacterium]